jgi:hypothetical protein
VWGARRPHTPGTGPLLMGRHSAPAVLLTFQAALCPAPPVFRRRSLGKDSRRVLAPVCLTLFYIG